MPHVTSTDTKFFTEVLLVNSAYTDSVSYAFKFRASGMIITCDADGYVEWSYDSINTHGKIYFSDAFAALDGVNEAKIWLRTNGNPIPCRIWAWLEQK